MADVIAFAKAVAPRKAFIFALQKSNKQLSLLIAFRQDAVSNRTTGSSKTLGAMHAVDMAKKTKTYFSIIFIATTLLACGPRSGIQDDVKDENAVCGVVDNPNPRISPQTQSEEHGRKLFKQNCAVCHSLNDQKIVGPGFGGLLDRLPGNENFFKMYISNSDSLVKSSNPYALKLQNDNNSDFKHAANNFNLSQKDIEDLVSFVKIIGQPIP